MELKLGSLPGLVVLELAQEPIESLLVYGNALPVLGFQLLHFRLLLLLLLFLKHGRNLEIGVHLPPEFDGGTLGQHGVGFQAFLDRDVLLEHGLDVGRLPLRVNILGREDVVVVVVVGIAVVFQVLVLADRVGLLPEGRRLL